jgi:hypothetical protein
MYTNKRFSALERILRNSAKCGIFLFITDAGEENSTTQTRTLGVVTEVKSGNNTVK